MDSDDEEILQREQRRHKTGETYHVGRYLGHFPTRLYEEEEQKLLLSVIFYRDNVSKAIDDPPAPKESGFTYRFVRFYRTVKGFHTGALDLAGRHEHRYVSLIKRWRQFSEDVTELLEHSTEHEDVLRGADGEPFRFDDGQTVPITVLTVDPPHLQRKFEKKWRMRVPQRESLEDVLADVRACLGKNPFPRFQTRNLLDFPPELLYQILKSAEIVDVRSLSATCVKLRQLALPYVFKTRRFAMEFKPRYPSGASEEELHGYARGLATIAQKRVLEEMAFLLSRGDIAAQVEDLFVGAWADIYLERAGWQPADNDVRDLLLPITRRLEDVIAHTPNLQQIRLTYLHLTQELMRRIFALPRLLHLELMSWQIADQPHHDCPPSPLLNLTLFIGEEFGPATWDIIPRLGNLQWLLVHALENASRILPPLSTLQRWNPFVTLKKAYIGQLRPFEWDDLVIIFAAASAYTQSTLPLTHLKLSFTYGIPHDILHGLLLALEGSRLRCLVIDGICDVMPDFIGEIAHALPDLKSLTIYNRDGERQHECKGTVWPSPSWEYAQQLARFASLTHFGCNIDTEASWSPSIIQMFEGDFAEDLDDTLDDTLDDPMDTIIEDTKLFASHCPSLNSFAFHRGMVCRIDRSPSGRVSVEPSIAFRGVDGEIQDPEFYFTWPIVQYDQS